MICIHATTAILYKLNAISVSRRNIIIYNDKRPMGHIAHLRKQFKSINTYDYIISLIKRRKKNIINFMRLYWFFIWTKLNPLHPRMLCAKFGWNWPSGSGGNISLISSMYYRYFGIISSLEKGRGPSFEQNWIPFTQRCIVPSLVEIDSMVLEKKIY